MVGSRIIVHGQVPTGPLMDTVSGLGVSVGDALKLQLSMLVMIWIPISGINTNIFNLENIKQIQYCWCKWFVPLYFEDCCQK